MMHRREFFAGIGAAVTAMASGAAGHAAAPDASGLEKALIDIEAGLGGRLGVAVLDTGSGLRAGHRADERFPLCSTFKFLAAAAVLARVDAGKESLDRRLRIEPRDILAQSPIAEKHLNTTMSLAELCEAAITVSDNAAANLLLAQLGGPTGLTQSLRALGDQETRLDRWELELNEALPNDPRDTTTPAAMVRNLQNLVLGEGLSPASRGLLAGWLIANKTGDNCLRAGAPAGWRVGDKTGSGERGTRNDIAIFWPPGHAPIVVAAYITGAMVSPELRNAGLAAVAKAIAASVSA